MSKRLGVGSWDHADRSGPAIRPAAGATAIPITTTLGLIGIHNGTCSLRQAVQSVNTNQAFPAARPPIRFASNSIDLVAGQTHVVTSAVRRPARQQRARRSRSSRLRRDPEHGRGHGGHEDRGPSRRRRVIQVGGSSGNSLTDPGIEDHREARHRWDGAGNLGQHLGSSLNLIGATVDGTARWAMAAASTAARARPWLTDVTASDTLRRQRRQRRLQQRQRQLHQEYTRSAGQHTEGLGAGIANLSSARSTSPTRSSLNNSVGQQRVLSGTITSGNNNLIRQSNNFCHLAARQQRD